MVLVGIIVNAASGRDIRRLVTGASVFDNAEKGSMVVRLMAGLGATGVDRVLLMPTEPSVAASLERHLRARRIDAVQDYPELEWLDMPARFDAGDTTVATKLMVKRGVTAVCVLGGDGTHRLVAHEVGQLPLLALSTGTNNAFPEMREATVAGLAAGLVATGAVPADKACRAERALRVQSDDRLETALVDVAVSRALFTGSRALWRGSDLSELYVAFADPTAVGLSAIPAAVGRFDRGLGIGAALRLSPPERAHVVVQVALAPGLVVPVGIDTVRVLRLGEAVTLQPGRSVVAVDGEREIERTAGQVTTVTLVDGPRVIDVPRTLRLAQDATLSRLPPDARP